jgi:hypothetical protein
MGVLGRTELLIREGVRVLISKPNPNTFSAVSSLLARRSVGASAVFAPASKYDFCYWTRRSSIISAVAVAGELGEGVNIDTLENSQPFDGLFHRPILHEPCEGLRKLFKDTRVDLEAHVLRSNKEDEHGRGEGAVTASSTGHEKLEHANVRELIRILSSLGGAHCLIKLLCFTEIKVLPSFVYLTVMSTLGFET